MTPTDTRKSEGRKYPRDFLLAELKRVAGELGKIPTMEEFEQASQISPYTLAARFKGWKGALESAGFDPTKARLTYDDLELLEELRRVAKMLGETPHTTRFAKLSDYGVATVTARLGGSWARACEMAGLPPPKMFKPTNVIGGWNKGTSKVKISEEELRYLYEVEGKSASAIAQQLGVSVQTLLRRMKQFGITVRKLQYAVPRETTIETMMYAELERRQVHFVKQQVVDGLWVVDALVPGARIVIEVDGEYWHSRPEMQKRDQRKDAYLKSRGYTVMRFTEAAIRMDVAKCVDQVVERFLRHYSHDK